MSDHVLPSASKSWTIHSALPWLVGAGVYALLLTLGPQLLNDPDTYSHVAVGRWILSHGAVPDGDPFSFSMHGAPWITFEWLSQILYAAIFAFSGWNGVVTSAAAATALALGLMTRFLLRELAPTPALLMILAAVVLLAPHLLARPHVLTLPVMVTWAAALVRNMDRHLPPPYWALPLLVLWANLHGSAALALGLIGPAVLEAWLAEKRPWRLVLRRWLPFSALAAVACCLTPYGVQPLLMPLTTLGAGQALLWISEWRPQDFGHPGAFEILLLGSLFALSRGITLPATRLLVVLGLVHFSLAQARNADLLAVLAPLYLAAPLARQIGARTETEVPTGAPRGQTLIALGLAAMAAALQTTRDLRPSSANTPAAAIASAGLVEAGPVLNDYAFGGYLIYSGIPTFIDGRSELFGGPFIDRYNRAISLADLNDFIQLLEAYGIRSTLLAPSTPAVALLDHLPGWQRVYSDEVAVVHKRRMANE